ncbi:MAG: hypothetical protein K9N07_10775 [Candidatus Cloacimonetes bacterium]|nr:hypothetical protein [Candidatus Cloacimonadota bacterium]
MNAIIKKKLIVLGVVLTFCVSFSLAAPVMEKLFWQANEYTEAMVNNKIHYLMKLTNPDIVKEMGGLLKATIAYKYSMRSSSIKFNNIQMDQPSIIVSEKHEDIALIPIQILSTIDSIETILGTYLLAFSWDGGENWYFIDGLTIDRDEVIKRYPILASNVNIPKLTNSYVDQIFREIEEAENKPIDQVINEAYEESQRVIWAIEKSGKKDLIVKREGKEINRISIVRLKEYMNEFNIKY